MAKKNAVAAKTEEVANVAEPVAVEEVKPTKAAKERRIVRVLVVRDGQKRIIDFSSTAHENPEYAARVYASQTGGEVLE